MSMSGVSSSSPSNPFFLRPKPADETAPKGLQSARIADTSLNLKAMPLPADHMQKLLEAQFTYPVGGPDNAPSELYAVVKVGNETVGKIYNTGCWETPNSFAGRVQFGGPDEDGLSGPALAQHRAEKIAKACGGTIVKSGTATTQAEFDARPPRQFYVDYEAMNAEIERLRQSATERQQGAQAARASMLGLDLTV